MPAPRGVLPRWVVHGWVVVGVGVGVVVGGDPADRPSFPGTGGPAQALAHPVAAFPGRPPLPSTHGDPSSASVQRSLFSPPPNRANNRTDSTKLRRTRPPRPCLHNPHTTRLPSFALQRTPHHRSARQELWAFSNDDLRAVADYLGEKPYFFGDRPTTIDCVLYGHLVQFLYIPLDFPQKAFMAEECPNLVRFVERFREAHWKDWEDKCSTIVQPAAPAAGGPAHGLRHRFGGVVHGWAQLGAVGACAAVLYRWWAYAGVA